MGSFVYILDRIISKIDNSKNQDDSPVYRGIKLPVEIFDKFINKYNDGKTLILNGF